MAKRAKTSTTKNQAWQVKGVTPETREAIKQAARKSGMTIGQWVDETLHREAVAELTGKAPQNLPMETLETQFQAINDKLDRIDQPFWRKILGR